VAFELGWDYGMQYADADLRGAGVSDDIIEQLDGDRRGSTPTELAAMQFARRVTIAASQISDREFQEMLQGFDVEQMVALVHTIAFANF
jgi:alkylhydroperoxidase family enzyme